MILCDPRFAAGHTLDSLPRWLRSSVRHYEQAGGALAALRTFFETNQRERGRGESCGTAPMPVLGMRQADRRGGGGDDGWIQRRRPVRLELAPGDCEPAPPPDAKSSSKMPAPSPPPPPVAGPRSALVEVSFTSLSGADVDPERNKPWHPPSPARATSRPSLGGSIEDDDDDFLTARPPPRKKKKKKKYNDDHRRAPS